MPLDPLGLQSIRNRSRFNSSLYEPPQVGGKFIDERDILLDDLDLLHFPVQESLHELRVQGCASIRHPFSTPIYEEEQDRQLHRVLSKLRDMILRTAVAEDIH